MALPRPVANAPKPATETVVVSYPKCGRTWLRALVGKTLVDHYGLPPARLLDTGGLAAMAGLPSIGYHHDGTGMVDRRSWRDLQADKSAYRDNRVILLGRDVRDMLVSAYFQATRRIGAFDGPISAFVRDERYGVDKVLTFYRQWHAARQVPRAFTFVRYEAMHADPAGVLAQVLDFIGARGVAPATIAAAVHFARFENLRSAEAENRFGDPALATDPGADPDTFKVRKGKVGGFRDYLSTDDVAWIDAAEAERGCEFTRPAA